MILTTGAVAFICGIKLVSKNMTLLQLQAVLRIIYAHERVIGVDVTGECSSTLDYFTEVKEAGIDSKTNEELIRMIVSENQEKSVCVNV